MEQLKQRRNIELDPAQFTDAAEAGLAKLYNDTMKSFVAGSIVPGKVLEVRPNEVLVDIGYKSEGSIPAHEFKDIESVKPGDSVSVLLSEIEDDQGMVVLSKERADELLRWETVLKRYTEGSVCEGTIKARVRGGLIVDVDGVESFLPGSQIDVMPVRNTDALIGNRYEFKIIKISSERKNIILSRRELMEERLRDRKKQLMTSIDPGQRRTGRVKNITDFGVFVDLDGLDGLLHITDMSWGRIKHPSEMVTVGMEIEVVILEVDHDRERVSLGLKQALPNPWDDIENRFPVGSRLRGKVVNLVPYGAFVELERGVEGLVHVSELSWTRRVARASDVLALGQDVDVVVLSINKTEQKIALGVRQMADNPWDTVQERYPVGSRVKGTVRNFTSYGAFVELEDGIDGMIHISDMSWTRKINHPSELLNKADEVEAVVLEVDPGNNRISLGLKQAQEDPWTAIMARYEVGQIVKGKVTKVATFGAFVQIAEGVDGLVHISQISDERVERVKDKLNIDDEIEARIMRVDRAERRIGLSIKAAKMPEEEFLRQRDDLVEGLRRGENMVDLAGAFDEALGGSVAGGEEWRPGEGSRDSEGGAKRRNKREEQDDEE